LGANHCSNNVNGFSSVIGNRGKNLKEGLPGAALRLRGLDSPSARKEEGFADFQGLETQSAGRIGTSYLAEAKDGSKFATSVIAR
jgi:hypothetical protein